MGTGERDAASDASAASPPEPGGGGAGLRAAGRVAALGLLFAVLTLGVTYPMVEDPTELLGRRGPAEGPHFVGDARAALGYVQRGADAFEQRGSIWPIVFSNPDVHVPPAYLFVAGALAHGTGSAVGAHNAVLWGSVFLAFVCMYGLVRHLTGDDVAALYAAVFFGGANYVVHHLIAGHANQVQVFWFPLAFWVTELALERPGWARGAILGGVIGLTALWVVHYAVFLAVLLPVYVVFRAPGRLVDRRFLVGLVMMGVVALCLCGPYLVGSMEAGPVERTLRVNQRYSLRALENLLIPDAYQHIGVLPILLALAGLLVPAKVAVMTERIAIDETVYFNSNMSTIREVSFDLLNEVADTLITNPDITRIRIEGHTDSRGSASYNKHLSQGRADAVRAYLVERGVEAERLDAVGYGEERPIDLSGSAAAHEKNRRVDFFIEREE